MQQDIFPFMCTVPNASLSVFSFQCTEFSPPCSNYSLSIGNDAIIYRWFCLFFSSSLFVYRDVQLILYIDCESYKCVEFIGSAKVRWGHKSFLYITSCHLQMIVILLLHIQFEYFLLSLADVLSVGLQLHSDQKWQSEHSRFLSTSQAGCSTFYCLSVWC